MGHLFMIVRLGLFALVFAGAAVVLGISANLTTRLLSTGIHDFLLFSLVVSGLTIVVFILLALRSQPRIDAVILAILIALWLTMGAYSQDIIGQQFCYALKGQTIAAKNDTTFSAENYCRQMKTMLAFSWANFVFLVLALIGLLTVVLKLYARGDRDIWKDSMSDVELFQEKELPKPPMPIEYPAGSQVGSGIGIGAGNGIGSGVGSGTGSGSASGSGRGGQTLVYLPGSRGAPVQHQVIQQQPGHSVIIHNGQVTQVPGSVTSA